MSIRQFFEKNSENMENKKNIEKKNIEKKNLKHNIIHFRNSQRQIEEKNLFLKL